MGKFDVMVILKTRSTQHIPALPEEDQDIVVDNMHENLVKFRLWFRRYAGKQTDIQICKQTRSSQFSAHLPGE